VAARGFAALGMHEDTIFAVASGAGRAAIAVMRISGPASAAVLRALAGRLPASRRASLRRLRDANGAELDRALVLWLPGPGSYSGEDAAELHLHGGRAVIEGVADALVAQGARPAEAGEFTRRAFLNGRMDLIEAEAVGDLVEAETSAQRAQALRQLDGALGVIYRDWAERLRVLLAQQEALIDFPDEDLPVETEALALGELAALTREIGAHLDDGRRGERLREGLVFAVTGAPNVGKSSLVNALAERDVAIVAASPGTTRDALETRVVLGGVPVTLVDTAGLRETEDSIEAEGVRRARARAAAADLVIVVGEAGGGGEEGLRAFAGAVEDWGGEAEEGLGGGLRGYRPVVPGAPSPRDPCVLDPSPQPPPSRGGGEDGAASRTVGALLVANKIDLGGAVSPEALGISVRTGAGMDVLRARLADEARTLTETAGPPPLTRARHRAALQEAAACLVRAVDADLAELRAEDLRLALRALGRITGQVGVEDLLDTIFRHFCIGK
jgi:tRNA modification GTPase